MALRGTLTHWKTRTLAAELGIQPCFALGLLEALWHTTAELAPAGNIGRLPNRAIAMEMFYEGDADGLIEALLKSGHLDRNKQHRLVIHDWLQHADYNTKRKVERRGESMVGHDASSPVITHHKSIPEPDPEPEPVVVPEPVPEPKANTLPQTANADAGDKGKRVRKASEIKPVDPRFGPFKDAYFAHNVAMVKDEPSWGGKQATCLSRYLAETPGITVVDWQRILDNRARSDIPQGEPLSSWIERAKTFWREPLDRFGKPRGTSQISPTPMHYADPEAMNAV